MPKLLLVLAALSLPLVACSNDGDFYDRCGDGDECEGDLTCFTIAFDEGADGAMCTADCVEDRDCPGNGACYELIGDPVVGQRVCYERCIDDFSCPPGFLCADTLDEAGAPTGDAICLPCPSSGC